jgi:prefoldin beta subunit
VFKLIGPALVAQDADDARATVSRRLAAISSELERVGSAVAAAEGKAADKQRALMAAQQRMMAAQQQQQQAAAAAAGPAAA